MTVIHRFIYQHICQDGSWRLHDSIRTGVSEQAQLQGNVVVPIDETAAAQPTFGGLGTIKYKCRFIESEELVPSLSTSAGTPVGTPVGTSTSCSDCILYTLVPCLICMDLCPNSCAGDPHYDSSESRARRGVAARRRKKRRQRRRRRHRRR